MADTHKFGGKTIAVIAFIGGALLFQSFYWNVIHHKDNVTPEPITTECKADSLQSVIDSLTSDYEIQREGWENKEKRYENIIFHYQYGLGYIKDYDPATYKKIIRIAMLKEDFSYDVEKEFKEQVNINKF
jgi:hypothetical protein